MTEVLLLPEEVAEILRWTVREVYRRKAELGYFKLGRALRFPRAGLTTFLESNEHTARPPMAGRPRKELHHAERNPMPSRKKNRHGQGSITLYRGRYRAAIQIAGVRHVETFDLEENAVQYIAGLKSDHVRGRLGIPDPKKRKTLRELTELWRQDARPDWTPDTERYYDEKVAIILAKFGGAIADELEAKTIKQWLRQLQEDRAPRTVNMLYGTLRTIYRWGVAMEWVDRNPMAKFKAAKEPDKDVRTLKPHEIRMVLDELEPDDRAFYSTMFFLGLRRMEIFRQRWEWVDTDTWDIRIDGKTGKHRLPIPGALQRELKAYGMMDRGLMFPGKPGPNGEERMLNNKNRSLWGALKRAEIPRAGVSNHTFRHSLATILETLGARDSVISAILRHGKRSGPTRRRYTHATRSDILMALEAVVQAVEDRSVIALRA